jgi:hypothetical protein
MEGMNELSQNDKELLGRLFELVGYAKASTGLRFARDTRKPDNKYLGRLIEDINVHVLQIEQELNQFAREWGYE